MFKYIVLSLLHLFIFVLPGESLHLHGTWKANEFYIFLAKFGFQQTDMHDDDLQKTQGYIYGNITSKHNVSMSLSFVALNSKYFVDFYSNNTVDPRTKACPTMFNKIDAVAWDSSCNNSGKEDFLRKIPCPSGGLCDSEKENWVIPGYQFTYKVQNIKEPRFWYISMVSCYRNTTDRYSCFWMYNPANDIEIDYDIWLVNGHPFMKHINPFEHQFSFELHDIFEMYMAFFILYTFLVPVQLYALFKQKHVLPVVLTTCMCMEYTGIVFNFVHVFKFSFDGEGVDLLKVVGNFIDNVAQCLFMLLLLLIVKGWTITQMDLTCRDRIILFSMWGTYTLANMGLFVWNLTEIDIISDIDEWQTLPGLLIQAFRIAIMVWFLFELKKTFVLEKSVEKQRFYLHFGAGFLVWFVYLPILAVICTQISALWRYKTLYSVTYAADFLSYCVMIHLLWPSRSYMYFNLKTERVLSVESFEFTDLVGDTDTTSEDSGDTHEGATLLKKTSKSKRPNSANRIVTQALVERCTSPKRKPQKGRTENLTANGSAGFLVDVDNCDSGIESVVGHNGENGSRRQTYSRESSQETGPS